ILRVALHGIAFFLRDRIGGVALVLRGVGLGIRHLRRLHRAGVSHRLFLRVRNLRVALRAFVRGLRFLLADVLVVAGLVVALLLRDVVRGLSLRHADIVVMPRRRLVLGV